eukprot:SM002283S07432  [mRNA]  locus=s2283:587:1581:+ [translate_table: standard]
MVLQRQPVRRTRRPPSRATPHCSSPRHYVPALLGGSPTQASQRHSMSRTPVARLLLITVLAATTLRADARASVSGYVYCDSNRNGVIDGGHKLTVSAMDDFLGPTQYYREPRCSFPVTTSARHLLSNELPTEQDSPALYYGCTIKQISSSNSNCQVIGPCNGGDVGIYVVDPNRKATDLCAC